MKRHRRSARRANQTTVELLEDRQLLTADFGDATLLSDQGLIPGPELQDLRLGGTGVTMFPEQFSPDQLRYSVTPSPESDGIRIEPFANEGDIVRVNGRVIDSGASLVLRDLAGGETVQIEVWNATAGSRFYEVMNLPVDFPLQVLQNDQPDTNPGSIYVTPRPDPSVPTSYLARIDHDGVPDFVQTFYPNQGDGRGPQLKLADFKRHANGHYTYADGYRRNEFNRFDYEIVVLDENFREIDRVITVGDHMNHTDFHDFLILENGDYALISYNGIERDGVFYEDSVIQVIDPVTREEKFLWNSWDEIGINIGDPELNEVVDRGEQESGESRIPEYAHINSLFQDENGDYIASLRFTSSIVKIDGETSEIIWRLGGLQSDFEIDDPWGGPCGQHTAQINSKGNLIYFDNGTPCPDLPEYADRPDDAGGMRYAEYELDEENMTATLVREIRHPTYRVGPTGSVQELPNDHVLVSWGLPGTNFTEYSLVEYDANNEPVREYDFAGRDQFFFSYRAWYAEDANYPTLAADNGASHTVVDGIHLGSGVDVDEDGQPSASSGDDQDVYFDDQGNLANDEDGVRFVTSLIPGDIATVEVDASTQGILNAFIDFNRDGDWEDEGEHVFADQDLSAGTNSLTFQVPADALQTSTWSRFRFSTQAGLTSVGPAVDGEVEDHPISITSPPPLTLTDLTQRTGDQFGQAVSISGDYAVVAAPHSGSRRTGAVHIYENTGDEWTFVKEIVAPNQDNDIAGGDRFGWSVGLQGNTLVVGAPREENGEADKTSGAAYVFDRNEGGANNWGLVQRLRSADTALGDQFGSSVSIDDDSIVVGARLNDGPTKKNTGAAYVFKRKQSNHWQQVRKLSDSAGLRNDQFGFSVDIEGNNVIVGAPGTDYTEVTDEGNVVHQDSGSAYVYHRDVGSDVWELMRKHDAPDTHNNVSGGDRFGFSVAIDKSVAVVGAFREEESEGDLSSGAAYVLRKNAGERNSWSVARKLVASDPALRDQFGYSVDVHNDRVAVGARLKRSDDGRLKTGAVFVFDRFAGQDNWREVRKFEASDASPRDYVGSGVAVSGEYTLAGAPLNDEGGQSAGNAYIFEAAITNTLVTLATPDAVPQPTISSTELEPIVDAAVEHWRQQPLTQQQLAALENLTIGVGQLQPGILGLASGSNIAIDDDGAGFGWYVDPTPFDTTDDVIGNRMDLLTAVTHEIGHALGHRDTYRSGQSDDIMFGHLNPGERRTLDAPSEVHSDSVFAVANLDLDEL